mmetsp:Transcript_34589/g.68093  ORF Transcript_34589/g.68093 Transcript_34589/m.68093 type:complete len:360 (-) Transcript_34589:256-1335(-)
MSLSKLNSVPINNSFAFQVEDKVKKLANHIHKLQEVLEDTQIKTKTSEQKVRDLRSELAQAEKDKKEILTSLNSFTTKPLFEKERYNGLFQKYIDQIEWLKNDSGQEMEAVILGHADAVNSVELRIKYLEKKIKALQDERFNSKNLATEVKMKVSEALDNIEKEGEARKNAEKRAAAALTQFEDETCRELAKLHAVKNQELSESAANFTQLQNKYLTQSQTICIGDKIIGRYEDERTSIPRIAKLGVTVAGELTRESLRKFYTRSRFLSIGASSRGRPKVKGNQLKFRPVLKFKHMCPVTQKQDLPDEALKRQHSEELLIKKTTARGEAAKKMKTKKGFMGVSCKEANEKVKIKKIQHS